MKNSFTLKKIKERGLKRQNKKYFSNEKNFSLKRNSYNEKRAKFLFIKYKKFNKQSARNELIEMCYPYIFAVLKEVGKKINTTKSLLNHDDLFNEGILIIDKCINGYKLKYKVQFNTFIWISLYRGFIKFLNKNLFKPSKVFTSISNFEENNEDFDLETLESLESKKYRKEVSEYLKCFEPEIYDDLFKGLGVLEMKIIYLKQKKYDANEIKKILEINSSKYYKLLKNIKEKTRRKML